MKATEPCMVTFNTRVILYVFFSFMLTGFFFTVACSRSQANISKTSRIQLAVIECIKEKDSGENSIYSRELFSWKDNVWQREGSSLPNRRTCLEDNRTWHCIVGEHVVHLSLGPKGNPEIFGNEDGNIIAGKNEVNIRTWENKRVFLVPVIIHPPQMLPYHGVSTVGQDYIRRAREIFIKDYPFSQNCTQEGQTVSASTSARDVDYLGGICILQGGCIVNLKHKGLYTCDGVVPDDWRSNTYYIGERLDVVVKVGIDSIILDYGDYDDDGKMDALFWSNGYNEDGYVLFYDHFRKSIEYKWHYH